MAYAFASATVLLLLITDPFGNIPIFVNALRGVAPERRMRVILREVLIAFLLLLAFMFVGDGFLQLMDCGAVRDDGGLRRGTGAVGEDPAHRGRPCDDGF